MTQPQTNSTWPVFAEIEEAAARLSQVSLPTPCVRSEILSSLSGANVLLKLENMQATGSFKSRGAYMKIASLHKDERIRGVVAASAGNHAQGVAFHATRLGIPAKIVMPLGTPYLKIRRTEEYGARVMLHGTTLSESLQEAHAIADRERLAFISGYDDSLIVAGAGTIALEMLRESPKLDVLLVPTGGGGLLCGSAIAARHLDPTVEIIGVQTESYPSLYNALRGLPEPAGGATIAEGVGVKRIGTLNLDIARAMIDDVVLIDEPSIEQAIYMLLEGDKVVAEGAGAIGVAALLAFKERFAGKSVGIIISGGNIDTGMLASVIARVRLTHGRVARLDIQILDMPGVLARVAGVISDFNANILEVVHQRNRATLPARCASLQVTIETKSSQDVSSITRRLREAGLAAEMNT